MTEAEWPAVDDPYPMLSFLRGRASDRKLRLFAAACCRRLFRTVRLHPWYDNGVAVAERFADGAATAAELEQARRYPPPDWCRRHAPDFDPGVITAAGQPLRVTKLAINACWNAMEVEDLVGAADCASTNAAWAATQPGPVMPDDGGVSAGRLAAERVIQAALLREVVGTPFRPVSLDPAWRTAEVLALAHGVYEGRAFDVLPILADALQDAGCEDADILDHCRSGGEHVRGCWVVDLVLGRA